jgi:15-cis-phytoene synthase
MGAALAEWRWDDGDPKGRPTHADDGRDGARLAEAYRHCAEVVRASGSSFASAFWMLPRPRRDALHAVYAFCRLADDIADDPAVRGDRRRLLERWRDELDAAYDGRASGVVAVALGDAARRFALPRETFLDLLAGVESDLTGARIETTGDLDRYCYRVASTVGLLVVRILGFRNPRALEYAQAQGIAVQLTNVLRDVGDDARSGRVYLARADLERFAVDPAALATGRMTEGLRCLLAHYGERARIHYERAAALLPPEDRHRLRAAEAMGLIYRRLLDELHRRGFPCLGTPLRLSRRRRVALAAAVWLGVPRALEALGRRVPPPALVGS